MISPFREGYIFTKLRENKTLAKIFEFTVLCEENRIGTYEQSMLPLRHVICQPIFLSLFVFHQDKQTQGNS